MAMRTREYPVLGYSVAEDGSSEPVVYPGDKHLLTVAPNRSGKKTTVIAPNLIRLLETSMVLTDPKGELAMEFARWRAQHHKTAVFDPFHIVPDWSVPSRGTRFYVGTDGTASTGHVPYRARFNPVDMVARSAHPVADAKMIAAAIIIPTERDPHWGNGARALYSAFVVFAALDPLWPDVFPRTLEGVWQALSLPGAAGPRAPSPPGLGKPPEDEFAAFVFLMQLSKVCRGFVARSMNRFLRGNEKEMASILSSIYTNCSSIFDDPEIIDNLSETTVDFENLQREATTIFLCLPGIRSETHKAWFRLLLTCIFSAIEKVGLPDPETQAERPKTLFILDEFGTTLGRMDTIRDALPRMPGYGVQFWPFVQDLNQLKSLYGDAWETFVSNSGVIQTFGGSLDLFTAEYLSKLTGQETVSTTSISTSTHPTAGIGTQAGFTGRPLYYPHEVAGINNEREGSTPGEDRLRQLLIFDGHRVFETQRYEYFRDDPEYVKFYRRLRASSRRM